MKIWIFWWPGELELGLEKGSDHTLLVQQLGVDGHYDLVNVGSGHCALGLSKGTLHTCLEPRLGTPDRNVHGKSLSPRSLRATHPSNRLHTLPRRMLSAVTVRQAPEKGA